MGLKNLPVYRRFLDVFWYDHQTMKVSWNGQSSRSFHTSNGVRQCGVLSPALFGVYIDVLSTAITKINTGCQLNIKIINHLLYADDIVLFSPSLAGLRKLLDASSSIALSLSIKFNPEKKTVCMCFKPPMYKTLPNFDVYLCDKKLMFVKVSWSHNN